jgi:hypothetical protein
MTAVMTKARHYRGGMIDIARDKQESECGASL